MNALTKINGTKLKLSSKAKVGVKTHPNYRLGSKQKNNFLLYISFKKDGIQYIKEKMVEVIHHPIPKHISKNYLTKNTIVKTESGYIVRITNLNEGRLIGALEENL